MFSASESMQAITRSRALDSRLEHHLVVRRPRLDVKHLHLLECLAHVGVVVEHHERRRPRP